MKFAFLAAAAIIAGPALAQTTPMQPGTTSTTGDGMSTDDGMSQDAMTQQAPTTDSSMPDGTMPDSSMPQQMPMTPTTRGGTMPSTGTMNGDSTMADPTGGYQPSAPPMQGTPPAGATVRFQPAMSPDQAYPAPAPLASYPICKAGQYDNCMQASDARSSRTRSPRRRR